MSWQPSPMVAQAAHEELAARVEASRGLLVIGAGGLGCPALSALVRSGVTRVTLLDDDCVELSNLQRQTLFSEDDVGKSKVSVAAERLQASSPHPERMRIEALAMRFVPDNALELARGHAVILDGSDNFASKFLVADAARLAGVSAVQAGAVRFSGWALAVAPAAGACLRCLFEDIPQGLPESCAALGVLGPVVGVLGSLQAALAIETLLAPTRAAATFFSYDALAGTLRRRKLKGRTGCPLCSGQIRDLDAQRYLGACAA